MSARCFVILLFSDLLRLLCRLVGLYPTLVEIRMLQMQIRCFDVLFEAFVARQSSSLLHELSGWPITPFRILRVLL